MEDFVPSLNDGYLANQFDDEVWGMEDSFYPGDESSRSTRKSLDSLRVKYQIAYITAPSTPAEIISFAWDGLNVLASSSTAKSARLQNILETSESQVAALENNVTNFRKDFS